MKINLKKNIKTYIYILLLLLVTSFFIGDVVFDILFPIAKFKPLSYWSRISCYFAYYTVESNYFVLFYFIFQLITNIRHYHSRAKFQWGLALTVYITITMFIYWAGLALNIFNPSNPDDGATNPYHSHILMIYRWCATTTLHVVIPVFMIGYYLLHLCGKEYYPAKKYHYFWIWMIEIYPAAYVTMVMIRGEIRYATNQPSNTWYPYEFLNYRHFTNVTVDVLIVCGFIVLILGMCALLQYFYLWINNVLFKKKNVTKIMV